MAIDVRGVCPLLQVYDMPTSVRFYRDTLGFEVVTASPNLGGGDKFHWCLLRLCGSQVMLNTAYEFDDERPVPPDPKRAVAHQDTCLYFGTPDVEAVYQELPRRAFSLSLPKSRRTG
jgi:glyoxylase I family protein